MYATRYKSHHDSTRVLKNKYQLNMAKEDYLAEKLNCAAVSRRVIYVHVPFCNKICSFCPFFSLNELKRKDYHHYIIREINKIRDYRYMEAPIDAVYFGGGTPTALSPEQMDVILSELRNSFHIRAGAEVSIETSATELTGQMLDVLKKGGVNRLSIGVQTFDDEARKVLGRRGNGEHAAERVKNAIDAGITNTNIDLIYNYTGQTIEMLREDLEIINSLSIAGLSFYSLMLHEKTPLYNKITEAEKAELADTEREYELFSEIINYLGGSGYKLFELTKLIRDEMDKYDYINVRHTMGSCIALGHGAGGNIEEYLYRNSMNSPDISSELRISSMGRVVLPVYRLLDQLVFELQKGQVNLEAYSHMLGPALTTSLAPSIDRLQHEGLLLATGSSIAMTQRGIFWGNNIIDEIMREL